MVFFDDDNYYGNYELLGAPVVAFLAANDTPEELWPRVEQWLEREIYGTDKGVLSYFESPFEKRLLQLLLERNHPLILYTYHSTKKRSFRNLKVSRTNPNRLVLRYRPAPNALQWEQTERLRMAVANLADEVVTIGLTSDISTLTTVELCKHNTNKPHCSL